MMAQQRNSDTKSLTAVLEYLSNEISDERVTIGQIFKALEARGFGPVLMIPALIIVLPTGAIPLMPAIVGIIISFTCIQMLLGKSSPWIPGPIRNISITNAHFKSILKSAMHYTPKIDKYFYERLVFLFGKASTIITALFCVILCIPMIFIGFIPYMPAILALPIFFFGLGETVRDGLLIIIGFITMLVSLSIAFFLYFK